MTAARRSAGLLLFRRARAADGGDRGGAGGDGTGGGDGGIEVLLGHMGGPFWARRDAGAWSVPKGEYVPPEQPWDAARREFTEELGLPPPDGDARPLGEVRQSGGKTVTVWAVEADLDPGAVVPGTFTMEWPRGSGRTGTFPELDRVAWFGLDQARELIVAAQAAFLDRLAEDCRTPPA